MDAGPRQVYALGRLQPAGGVISISAIPGERLKQIDPDVAENELIPANGILGVLASFDIGKTQLQALEKKAQLSDLKRNHEIQIAKAQQAQAEAALAQAEAKQKQAELQHGKLGTFDVAHQLAEQQYGRLLQLSRDDAELVTPHQLAKQANEMEMARQDALIARQSYTSTKDAADKAVAAAQANIRVAAMTLQQLAEGYDKQAIQQEIMVAQETLKRSVLLAPNVSAESFSVDAIECVQDCQADKPESYGPYTVLKVFVRPGEFVTQMPIMQLGDLSKMVCIAEVYEADVKELAEGQEVTLRSPAFAGDFTDGDVDSKTGSRTGGIRGRVQRIGNLIASPGLANRNPLAPADRSVVEVRIAISDEAAIKHAAKRVGLQVTVEFGEKPTDKAAP
ncbi:MAG: efflux RND transporter periplasmic adaptor subunit [Planctomycetota bacterium]